METEWAAALAMSNEYQPKKMHYRYAIVHSYEGIDCSLLLLLNSFNIYTITVL